ncbi:hypothetical protein H5410_016326 [Solanum commersonii]|uniref:Uncharacterized protein n=1 Tax=Solanum commersonii TaxID=4109 RepID=A0A9J5ZW34_SOLCO|nr:hypothetical protein H5410_016326 [Solanum commersonii]
MNLNQDLPDIQMWQNIHKIRGAEIRGHLRALLSLLGTQCDKVFVTQLMGSVSSLTELPIRVRLSMIPSAICTGDFLSLIDLYIFRSLRYVDDKHVELDYEAKKEICKPSGNTQSIWNKRGKMVHAGVFRLAEYYESYDSSKHTQALGVCRQPKNYWIRESVLPRMGFTTSMYNQIVPGSIDYLIQVVEEEEEEDPKEDPEEDLEEDPKEEVEEDHMEVSETGSNIYDPRNERVIDMSPKSGPDESQSTTQSHIMMGTMTMMILQPGRRFVFIL